MHGSNSQETFTKRNPSAQEIIEQVLSAKMGSERDRRNDPPRILDLEEENRVDSALNSGSIFKMSEEYDRQSEINANISLDPIANILNDVRNWIDEQNQTEPERRMDKLNRGLENFARETIEDARVQIASGIPFSELSAGARTISRLNSALLVPELSEYADLTHGLLAEIEISFQKNTLSGIQGLSNQLSYLAQNDASFAAEVSDLQSELGYAISQFEHLGGRLGQIDLNSASIRNELSGIGVDIASIANTLSQQVITNQKVEVVNRVIFNLLTGTGSGAEIETMGFELFRDDIALLSTQYEELRKAGADQIDIDMKGHELKEAVKSFQGRIDNVITGIGYIGKIAAFLGFKDAPKIAKAVQGGINVALGILSFATGNWIGGLTSIVSGLGGLFGGGSGGSETAAILEALQQISDQIQHLSEQLSDFQVYVAGQFARTQNLILSTNDLVRIGFRDMSRLLNEIHRAVMDQFLQTRGQLQGIQAMISIVDRNLNRLTAIVTAGLQTIYLQDYNKVLQNAQYYRFQHYGEVPKLTEREARDTFLALLNWGIEGAKNGFFHHDQGGGYTFVDIYNEVPRLDPWSGVNKLKNFLTSPQGYNLIVSPPSLPTNLTSPIEDEANCFPYSQNSRLVNPGAWREISGQLISFISATPEFTLIKPDRCFIQQIIDEGERFLTNMMALKTHNTLFERLNQGYSDAFTEVIDELYESVVGEYGLEPSAMQATLDELVSAVDEMNQLTHLPPSPFDTSLSRPLEEMTATSAVWGALSEKYFPQVLYYPDFIANVVFLQNDCRHDRYFRINNSARSFQGDSVEHLFFINCKSVVGNTFAPSATGPLYADPIWTTLITEGKPVTFEQLNGLFEPFSSDYFSNMNIVQYDSQDVTDQEMIDLCQESLSRLFDVTCCGCDRVGLKDPETGDVTYVNIDSEDVNQDLQQFQNIIQEMQARYDRWVVRYGEFNLAQEKVRDLILDLKERVRIAVSMGIEANKDLSSMSTEEKVRRLSDWLSNTSSESDRARYKAALITAMDNAGPLKEKLDDLSYKLHMLWLYSQLAFSEEFVSDVWLNQAIPKLWSGEQFKQAIFDFDPSDPSSSFIGPVEADYYRLFDAQNTDLLTKMAQYYQNAVSAGQASLQADALSPGYSEVYYTIRDLRKIRDVVFPKGRVVAMPSTFSSTIITSETTEKTTSSTQTSTTTSSSVEASSAAPSSTTTESSSATSTLSTTSTSFPTTSEIVDTEGETKDNSAGKSSSDDTKYYVTVGVGIGAGMIVAITGIIATAWFCGRRQGGYAPGPAIQHNPGQQLPAGYTGVVIVAAMSLLMEAAAAEAKSSIPGFADDAQILHSTFGEVTALPVNDQLNGLSSNVRSYEVPIPRDFSLDMKEGSWAGRLVKFRHAKGYSLYILEKTGSHLTEDDTYIISSCHPMDINGRPSVECDGEQSTLIYQPYELPAHLHLRDVLVENGVNETLASIAMQPFSDPIGNIALARVGYHAASEIFASIKAWWRGDKNAEPFSSLNQSEVLSTLSDLQHRIKMLQGQLLASKAQHPDADWYWAEFALDEHGYTLSILSKTPEKVTDNDIAELLGDLQAYQEDHETYLNDLNVSEVEQVESRDQGLRQSVDSMLSRPWFGGDGETSMPKISPAAPISGMLSFFSSSDSAIKVSIQPSQSVANVSAAI